MDKNAPQPYGGLQMRIRDGCGTVQGAVATWRLREQPLPEAPGRYRSLYHVRQDIRKLFEMR